MSVLDILVAVGANGGSATASEIVEDTGLPRSTVFRRLRELCEKSFLIQDLPSRKYTLGPRVLELGETAREELSSGILVSGPLLELVRDTGETATFSIIDVPWRLCVSVFETPSELRQVARVGDRYPLHLGAAGKAILAFLPEAVVDSVFTAHAIEARDAESMVRQLSAIRREGLATTTGERVAGACTVAAPVFVAGNIYGSVAAVGPAGRMKPRLRQHGARAKRTAALISGALSSDSVSIVTDRRVAPAV